MYSVYAGKTNRLPTISQRQTMYLDDSLEYTTVTISDPQSNSHPISGEYILTEIVVSRTLSFSMFIDPLFDLQTILKTDQIIELTFACSFLSNPFRFNWSMTRIIARLKDQNDPLETLSIHPFYDWYQNTFDDFGSWQGGPYNRWSPCGGNRETIPELFGAQKGATDEQRKLGESRLCRIVSVLLDHMTWVNMLVGKGDQPSEDLPLEMIKLHYDLIVKRISRIVPCQFNNFRLCVFTTVIAGCGLLHPGRHLRQLMFPIKGTASYKHLLNPVSDVMTKEKATALGNNQALETVCNDGDGMVRPEHHDMFMEYLSHALGFRTYCRDEVECILCESHPMRTLNCKDWFRKGMSLFDCNNEGQFFRRTYGSASEWDLLPPPTQYTFIYHRMADVFYRHHDHGLVSSAFEFGDKLRMSTVNDITYRGRPTNTSVKHNCFVNNYNRTQNFGHASVQVAYFYVGSIANTMNLKSMFVLGDGEKAVRVTDCNDIEKHEEGKNLLVAITKVLGDMDISSDCIGGCSYHRDPETETEEVTFFPGHLDKAFVNMACFVPIGSAYFFLVVAIPEETEIEQDENSLQEFNDWKDILSNESQRKVESFLLDFDGQAKQYMRRENLLRRIYVNNAGSILCFPANVYYHSSILPKRTNGSRRDLLIFHPLDGN